MNHIGLLEALLVSASSMINKYESYIYISDIQFIARMNNILRIINKDFNYFKST